jgi:hypothetical protein
MGTSLEKRPLGRPKRKWEVNIKRDVKGYVVRNGGASGWCPMAICGGDTVAS